MTGANWIAEKINALGESRGIDATIASKDVVFVRRNSKPDAYVGIVSTRPGDPTPVVSLDGVKNVHAQVPTLAMMIAIPRGTKWSGVAMRWLQSEGIAFGGVGDLLSAISYDDVISNHRNKTLAFVDDGLRRHSRVADLEWIDSKKVEIHLRNDVTIIAALDDAYDITMSVAREAARTLGDFDVLLKTNPNGSITSNGTEQIDYLGFQTLKWGELLAFLGNKGRQASHGNIRERLRRA